MYHRQRWQSSRMDLSVANETGLLCEGFATHVASVDPLASVQKEMLAEAAVPGERSSAYLATVRLVAGVDSHMLPQIVVLEEGLAALLAHRFLFPLVLRQHVLIEILLRDESSVAPRALVLGLVMRVLLMRVQTMTVAARLAAHVAHHRCLPVIQPGVRGQVTLDLELLAAVLAGVAVVLRVLAHKVRAESFFAGAHQAADDARELALAGRRVPVIVTGATLVLLGQVCDHRGPLVASEAAGHARECLFLPRHRIGKRWIVFHV